MKRGLVGILMGNRKFIVGFIIFIVILMGAIIAHQTIPFRYSRTGAFPPGLPPGVKNILGTDSLGRGIEVQLAEGVVNSVQIGLIAALIGTLVGALIGFTSGYYGGIIDAILRVLMDVFLSIPSLLFLILIASLMRGVTVQGMALIIALFAWASPARAATPSSPPLVAALTAQTKLIAWNAASTTEKLEITLGTGTTGDVHENEVWSITVAGITATYKADYNDGLTQIANGLESDFESKVGGLSIIVDYPPIIHFNSNFLQSKMFVIRNPAY